MKAFIDRIFKKRKKDAEQIEENKAILSEQIETSIKKYIVQTQATEVAVETIIEEVKQEEVKQEEVKQEEVKQEEVYTKPGHYFNDCNCVKCVRWRSQNAK
jgi:tryptophan 2,3-dioxygenase